MLGLALGEDLLRPEDFKPKVRYFDYLDYSETLCSILSEFWLSEEGLLRPEDLKPMEPSCLVIGAKSPVCQE